MYLSPFRSGVTPGEVLVMVVIIGVLAAMAIPYLLGTRENARRQTCQNHLKKLGDGLKIYVSRREAFPASSSQALLTADSPLPGSDNSGGSGAGFSWLVEMLPYLKLQTLYDAISKGGSPYDGRPQHLLAAKTQIPTFRCPSYSGPPFSQAPEYPPNSQALSNYVALGATHLASLYKTETLPIGGQGQPNGVIYPGSKTTDKDITDGLEYTLVACETIERRYAAWLDGTTAALVGLAEEPPPRFQPDRSLAGGRVVYEPMAGVRTTIDFGAADADPPRYYLTSDMHSGQDNWVHGPSSEHARVVNHLFANGSVRSISKRIDPRLYMSMISRAGGERP